MSGPLFHIHFGALAPRLAEQLGIPESSALRHLQRDADAIVRLRVRGLLTAAEGDKAENRLVKRIAKEVVDV